MQDTDGYHQIKFFRLVWKIMDQVGNALTEIANPMSPIPWGRLGLAVISEVFLGFLFYIPYLAGGMIEAIIAGAVISLPFITFSDRFYVLLRREPKIQRYSWMMVASLAFGFGGFCGYAAFLINRLLT